MIKTKDLINLKGALTEPRDIILIDNCIELWKKLEEFSEIGISYITEGDKSEIIQSLMNIVRIYLMIMRDYYKDDNAIEAIKNDLQSSLSNIFMMEKKGTLALRPLIIETGSKEQQVYQMITPFVSFVETNIYYAFLTADNELKNLLHMKFCELSSKAAGLYKEKQDDELPSIPSTEKPKKAKKQSKSEEGADEQDG